MASTALFIAWTAVLIAVPVLLILWLTESQTQRIRRLRRQGWTQQRIADHVGVSRTTVRRRLA